MKHFFVQVAIIIISLFTYPSHAQDVKLKKDIVTVDGEQKFQYEKRRSATEFTLYSLDKEKEILTIIRNTANSKSIDDNYVQIIFADYNVRVETIRLKGYSYARFLELLFKEKVLLADGSVDEARLQTFFAKYDENVTNRTIR
jgi:hypothetical protein